MEQPAPQLNNTKMPRCYVCGDAIATEPDESLGHPTCLPCKKLCTQAAYQLKAKGISPSTLQVPSATEWPNT